MVIFVIQDSILSRGSAWVHGMWKLNMFQLTRWRWVLFPDPNLLSLIYTIPPSRFYVFCLHRWLDLV